MMFEKQSCSLDSPERKQKLHLVMSYSALQIQYFEWISPTLPGPACWPPFRTLTVEN